jgi:hypothetical protein
MKLDLLSTRGVPWICFRSITEIAGMLRSWLLCDRLRRPSHGAGARCGPNVRCGHGARTAVWSADRSQGHYQHERDCDLLRDGIAAELEARP